RQRLAFGFAAGHVEGQQAGLGGDLADMRVVEDDEVELPRQFLDREALEILEAAPLPGDGHARAPFPFGGGGDHGVMATRMAPGHAPEPGHSPNSSRMRALCSPTSGAARGVVARAPSTRSGERVVTIDTPSSRVTFCSISR